MKVLLRATILLLISCTIHAGELALYYLPGAQVEYEGTGYRQVPNGWELKVKPRSAAAGFRWRHPVSENWSFHAQYWRNQPFFAKEDGNARDDVNRQSGQTRLSLQNILVDVRHPLAGSLVSAVAGVQSAQEVFQRQDIVFNLTPEAGQPTERITGYGAYIGFHGVRPGRLFYFEWEFLLGHLFVTQNSQKTNGGSIHDDGYTYSFRLETGIESGRWRFGAGYLRQLVEMMVPGGKSLPSGAAASLPINKTDFFSPFVSVSYEY